MTTLTRNQAHGRTARMDIRQVVQELNEALGPTLVAALTGIKDRKQPIRWARSDGPVPTPQSHNRLILAHAEWKRLISQENDHVARSFFIGGNPMLGEDTPITAIREGRDAELVAAVDAFLEGDGSW
ncbi:hypothetical protein OK351_04805 [Glutamicibacter sp. MNS18]|uniref:hypothetical protein n=1 Tax=Glutamicibacter sp. MNS18 TaxID=2989817 RepID=UPI0022364E91|nr:hypothetical protein [Glutamicibacter sp. MNS18]MCW4464825.1 hypothetical protein [Glutamicibacter sp. MNS18]